MPAGRSYEKRVKAKREAARAARKHAERMRKVRIGASIAGSIAVVVVVLLLFLGGNDKKPLANPTSLTGCTLPSPAPIPNGKQYPSAPKTSIDTNKIYVATLETTCGTIKMRMDPKVSPKTVNNFVFLARDGFYDGTFFHRVQNVPSSYAIVQGGDPKGTGQGGPGYDYIGETPPAGTKYLRGVVAVAKPAGNPPRNGSQFFFVVRDWPDLPAEYTILGKVDDATSFTTLDKMILAKGTDLGGLGLTPDPKIYILRVSVEELGRS